ncbi:MAG: GDP-mannose 4,6-dehydratase [Spirochaetia bacterium]|nr:GDP-mannose 4,6-dehydratase [Spirochaetia bacterium]
MKVLITGIHGFVGSHLCLYLLGCGDQVSGLDRRGVAPADLGRFAGRGAEPSLDTVTIFRGDLSTVESCAQLIQDSRPDAVIHLAGNAFVPGGWTDPADMLRNNALNTVQLLQGAREAGWKGRFLLASSSDVYGSASDLPITESTPTKPESPYASSKLAAEQMSLYFLRDGIETLIARPFNHAGPGQKEGFVIPSFLCRIRDAMQKGQTEMVVGDIESARDFTDVRDVARAYRILLEKGRPGEVYNVCSGKPVKIREILERAMDAAGARLAFRVDPALLRPEGPSQRYGSAAKISALGWAPELGLQNTVRDTWEYLQNTAAI